MKNSKLTKELKATRLQRDIESNIIFVNDLKAENQKIYDQLKDMSTVSANEAEKLQNRFIYNNCEIESTLKKNQKILNRAAKLLKDFD